MPQSHIFNPEPPLSFGARGFCVTIVRALGDRPRYLKAELMAQAADLLAAEAEERHRRVVIITGQAHLLDPAQLEELGLLTRRWTPPARSPASWPGSRP